MTLEQLRIFVAVAERLHMTQAGEALHLSQSAVSAAMATLERAYETRLFDRIGRRLELSAAGRTFLPQAKAVLARAEAAQRALVDLAELRRGEIAIHASQTVANYWLPSRLVRFQVIHPQIQLRVSVGNTAQVAQAVSDGLAELGIVEGRVDNPGLTEVKVGADRLAVVAPRNHPWAMSPRAGLSPEDFLSGQWVLRERGSGTRTEFESALRDLGVDPAGLQVVLELPSNEAVRAAVEAGGGVSALSELAAEPGLKSGALRRIKTALPQRCFHLLRHEERQPSRAAAAFCALLGV
jgi:DNA-binding transcriptional LysR family regulator